jgi:hypothetical protein
MGPAQRRLEERKARRTICSHRAHRAHRGKRFPPSMAHRQRKRFLRNSRRQRKKTSLPTCRLSHARSQGSLEPAEHAESEAGIRKQESGHRTKDTPFTTESQRTRGESQNVNCKLQIVRNFQHALLPAVSFLFFHHSIQKNGLRQSSQSA